MRSVLKPTFIIFIVITAACNRTAPPPVDAANGNLAPVDQVQPAQEASAQAPDYNPASEAVEAPEPPPLLPDYSQPPAPGDNYIWTPGYWNYADAGYYWVPGAWVIAPWVGALWTPPYWEFEAGHYLLHAGYWAPHIGFYGGVDYGFGYTGRGFYGGYWNGGTYRYNRAVTNLSSNVRNVYSQHVTNNVNDHISYNGGRGGEKLKPSAAETAVLREHRTAPVAAQTEHTRQAATNRNQFASINHGRPTVSTPNPLATEYRAPGAAPEVRAPQPSNQRPEARPETRTAAPPPQANRFERQPPAEQRPEPAPAARPQVQENRPTPFARPGTRQAPQQARPEPARPNVPENRPAPQPAARPAPTPRPVPAARPAPPPRQEPATAAKPEPRKDDKR